MSTTTEEGKTKLKKNAHTGIWPAAPGPKGRSWNPNSKGFLEVKAGAYQDLADDHEKTVGIGTSSGRVARNFVIPTVMNGKSLKPEEAQQLFEQGKIKPVGMYSTQEQADSEATKRSREFGHNEHDH